ncbi:MAG: ABC transporter ATP-binding protein [Actinomycetia bacterium]|nr:ABC transporter ATP-binding protein [Actinomycetes bacterium]MCP4960045.1 ABC transporter ATP-binding protein [Actinomycetes bacterium]
MTATAPPTSSIISLRGTAKTYGEGEAQVNALLPTDLEIETGEMVVILGPSGSGKTTLLNAIGGIEPPSAGVLEVAGTHLLEADDALLTAFRRDSVGFVFQFFNLVPTLTARENVELILELTGRETAGVGSVLEAVGLLDRSDHFPGQLSGGQQQRVAIARALAKEPAILLCDEPTGALDLETGLTILELLQQMHRQRGITVVMVTHNAVIADMADRVVHMRSGEIVSDVRNDHPVDAASLEW